LTNFVSVAKITRTRGIRGEVVAEILTDFPERFSKIKKVRLASESREFREELERFWFQKTRVVLKFKDRDRPHEVEELVGMEVQIPEAERVELPQDTYFDSDLVGCNVYEKNLRLGRIVGIFKGSGDNPNLVVCTDSRDEFMIPAVKQFVKEVDIDARLIRVELPPGLIEATLDRRKPRKKK